MQRTIIGVLLAAAGLLALADPARADYDPITWSTCDGGGTHAATASSGGWSLSGTIGQFDAGSHAAGPAVLGGGFWHGGAPVPSSVPEAPGPPGPVFRLHAPAPNPVQSACRLAFELPSPTRTRLYVHDVAGRVVRTLDLGLLSAGPHDAAWSADDDAGRRVASGVYFLKLDAGVNGAVRKVLVVR
jgi:hypothetical protein